MRVRGGVWAGAPVGAELHGHARGWVLRGSVEPPHAPQPSGDPQHGHDQGGRYKFTVQPSFLPRFLRRVVGRGPRLNPAAIAACSRSRPLPESAPGHARVPACPRAPVQVCAGMVADEVGWAGVANVVLGVEYGNQCYYDQAMPPSAVKADTAECNSTCTASFDRPSRALSPPCVPLTAVVLAHQPEAVCVARPLPCVHGH